MEMWRNRVEDVFGGLEGLVIMQTNQRLIVRGIKMANKQQWEWREEQIKGEHEFLPTLGKWI